MAALRLLKGVHKPYLRSEIAIHECDSADSLPNEIMAFSIKSH